MWQVLELLNKVLHKLGLQSDKLDALAAQNTKLSTKVDQLTTQLMSAQKELEIIVVSLELQESAIISLKLLVQQLATSQSNGFAQQAATLASLLALVQADDKLLQQLASGTPPPAGRVSTIHLVFGSQV